MKIPKVKTKKIKDFLKKLLETLGVFAFFTFLVLLAFSLVLGAFIFYKYSFLVEKARIEDLEKPLQFKEKTYQKLLEVWQEREERFEEADFKQYSNPFQFTLKEKRLSEERTQELLAIPLIQELLNTTNLYEFYVAKGKELLLIEERAQIWEELDLGEANEYQGTYSQNIRLLKELKKELTE